MRRPARDLERVWITNPCAAEMLDLGNALYGFMLALLEQAYAAGFSRTQRQACVNAATGLMRLLPHIAEKLVKLPADESGSGITAGLTFAVPRHLHGRAPAAAGTTTTERMHELVEAWRTVTRESPTNDVVDSIFEELRRLG